MDFNSPEFYTIAFVVAMALVALLMGRREHGPASTHIVQLLTEPDEREDNEDTLMMQRVAGGRVHIRREGMALAPDETINLVFTIRDDTCVITEKKGVKRRGAQTILVRGEVSVKCLRPIKYRIRYESQVNSTWASFVYDAASSEQKAVRLSY